MAYSLAAVFMVISNRLNEMGIALQGTTATPIGSASIDIVTSLSFGFYFACITGGVIILLALLKRVIAGKAE